MATKIIRHLVRRTATPGKVPTTSDLLNGELGANLPDNKLYVNDAGTIKLLATSDYDSLLNRPALGTAAALDAGVVNGVATLDSTGKIPTSQIPPMAISDIFTVDSEAEMLALVAERGDIAIRTDIDTTFVLQAEPASDINNWKQLLTPASGVQSVGLSAPSQFTVTGSPVTGTGNLTFGWNNQAQNTVLAAPTGGTGAPTFRILTASDIPDLGGLYVKKSGDTMTGPLQLPTGAAGTGLKFGTTGPTIDSAGTNLLFTAPISTFTGQVVGTSGTSSVPQFTQDVDATTGLSVTSGAIRFITGGTLRASMAASSFIPATNGTYDLGSTTQPWRTFFGKGGTIHGLKSVTVNTTTTVNDCNIIGSGNITITASTLIDGQELFIFNSDVGTVNVATSSGTISGQATVALAQNEGLHIVCEVANGWRIVSRYRPVTPVSGGGTGASTLTGYVKGNGTAAMTASPTVPAADVAGLSTVATTGSWNDLLNKPTTFTPPIATTTTLGGVIVGSGLSVDASGLLTRNALVAADIPNLDASKITTGLLPVARGGTGAGTLTGYVKGSGTAAFTASATIPNTDISGLGTASTYPVEGFPFVNLMRDSGRFAPNSPNVLFVTDGTFLPDADFFVPYNNTTFASVGKFIHNNTTNGGTAGELAQPVIDLLTAMGRTADGARYGSEFFVAEATMGNGTVSTGPNAPNSNPTYLMMTQANVVATNFNKNSTFVGWLRVTSGYVGMNTSATSRRVWKNGVDVTAGGTLWLSSADGWVHIRTLSTNVIGYITSEPLFYATSDAKLQFGCPAWFNGQVNPGLHSAPLRSVPMLFVPALRSQDPGQISYNTGVTDFRGAVQVPTGAAGSGLMFGSAANEIRSSSNTLYFTAGSAARLGISDSWMSVQRGLNLGWGPSIGSALDAYLSSATVGAITATVPNGFTSTGPIIAPVGTSSIPALQIGSSQTGLYGSTSQLFFSTGSTPRFGINGATDLRLGTSVLLGWGSAFGNAADVSLGRVSAGSLVVDAINGSAFNGPVSVASSTPATVPAINVGANSGLSSLGSTSLAILINATTQYTVSTSAFYPGGTKDLGTTSNSWRTIVANGGQSTGQRTITANTTSTINDYTIIADGSGITITLDPTLRTGQILLIKNINASSISVISTVGGTFDGKAFLTLRQYQSVYVQSTGTNWNIIAQQKIFDPVVTVTASATVTVGSVGVFNHLQNTSDITITIPDSTAQTWLPGDELKYYNFSDFSTSIVGAAGVNINFPAGQSNVLSCKGQYLTLKYLGFNTWQAYVVNPQYNPVIALTASASLSAVQVGKTIRNTSALPVSFTIQPHATVPQPAGMETTFIQVSDGPITLVAGAGVTINPPYGGSLVTAGRGATMVLKRSDVADTYDLISGQTVAA